MISTMQYDDSHEKGSLEIQDLNLVNLGFCVYQWKGI